MALLAKQRRPFGQQRRVDGAVRRMAQAAVLGHGRMLPQKGTALVGVTGVTGFIQRRASQQHGRTRPVGLVTVAAIELAEPHRMIRGLEKFGAFLQVALETYVRLCHPVEHGIVRRVDGMAIGARNLARLVGTALPTDMVSILVALETHAILRFRGRSRFLAEIQDGRAFLSRFYPVDMTARRSVAGLALQAGERGARISFHGMPGLEDGENREFRRLVVTLDAGVGTFLRVLDGADGGRRGLRNIASAVRGINRLGGLPGIADQKGESAPQPQQQGRQRHASEISHKYPHVRLGQADIIDITTAHAIQKDAHQRLVPPDLMNLPTVPWSAHILARFNPSARAFAFTKAPATAS
jgi:hypothetical protein